MTTEQVVVEPNERTFADRWREEKLLKKSKKKAQKKLEQDGVPVKEAKKLVKKAVNQIASKPQKRAAGRGR